MQTNMSQFSVHTSFLPLPLLSTLNSVATTMLHQYIFYMVSVKHSAL